MILDNENALVMAMAKRLNPYFDIEFEVWSVDGKSRIDMVLMDKIHNKFFGIEVKMYNHKRGMNLGEHLLQSMRYVVSEFKTKHGIKKMPILICPPISFTYLQCPVHESRKELDGIYGKKAEYYHDRHDRNSTHHSANGMIGSFGVGEVRTLIDNGIQYIYFTLSNQILWDSRPAWDDTIKRYSSVNIKGVHLVNYDKQISKKHDYRF